MLVLPRGIVEQTFHNRIHTSTNLDPITTEKFTQNVKLLICKVIFHSRLHVATGLDTVMQTIIAYSESGQINT